MDTEEMETKVKSWFKKGAKASKSAFEKAGDRVQNFTDKSIIKIEKRQLESQRDCKYEEMGMKLSYLLMQGAEINYSDQSEIAIIKDMQEEIKNLSDKIREKEQLI